MHCVLRYIGLLPLISLVSLSQSLSVVAASLKGTPGSTVLLNLQLTSGGTSPASLEWTINGPMPDIQSITAAAGPAATGASKAIQCLGNTCAVYGLNANPIPNGTVAVLTVQLASSASGNLVVQLSNTSASSVSGGGLGVTATNGTVSVIGPQLSITKTHSGSFAAGQNGIYTVTVSNGVGAASTSGTVTMTETVPSGLTLVSMA